jgi:hypothetical protein
MPQTPPEFPKGPAPDFIEVIDDALDPAFCRALIDRFEASPQRFAGRTGAGVDTTKKISTDLQLDAHADWSDALQTLHARTVEHLEAYLRKYHFALIAPVAMTVRHPASGEPVALTHDNFAEAGAPMAAELMAALYRLGAVQMQKYEAGRGNYAYWHCEVYPQAGHEAVHRTLLWMYYLNDVAEGGETDFFYQRRAVRPRAGRMVIAPAYFTHTHRGRIPLSGDKYILTSWMLLARPEQLYDEPG